MQPEIFGPRLLRNQPAARQRDAVHLRGCDIDSLLPLGEIDGTGKWREDDELSEGEVGSVGESRSGVEGRGPVAGQSENKRTQNVDAVAAEIFQTGNQGLAGEVEILVKDRKST